MPRLPQLRLPHRPSWLPELPTVFYTNPFELLLGVLLLLIAARGVLADAVTPSVDDTLPAGPRFLYLLLSAAAGILIVLGLSLRARKREPLGKILERAGLYLCAGAFAGYAVVLGGTNGWPATVNVAISVALALACVLRARAIRRADLIKLAVLTAANHPPQEKRA